MFVAFAAHHLGPIDALVDLVEDEAKEAEQDGKDEDHEYATGLLKETWLSLRCFLKFSQCNLVLF